MFRNLALVGLLSFSLGLAAAVRTDAPPIDLVLVLDDSGSMRKIDRNFLMRRIAGKFIRDAEPNTAIAVGIFSNTAELLTPLTVVSKTTQAQLVEKLERLHYRGRWTNIPDAITTAMDELRIHGRSAAQKYILLLTDGLVDTGERLLDQEGAEWLRQVAIRDAARDGIKIFSIALAGHTDEALLRQLAEGSHGEFFPVRQVAELPDVFSRIAGSLRARLQLAGVPTATLAPPTPAATLAPASTVAAVTANGSEVAPTVQLSGTEDHHPPQASQARPAHGNATDPLVPGAANSRLMRNWIFLGSVALLILSPLLWLALRARRSIAATPVRRNNSLFDGIEATSANASSGLDAYLLDITGVTGRSSYRLAKKRTMLGRMPADSVLDTDSIIIDGPSVGRHHALIETRRGGYWVTDQNSKNGTFINERLVREPTYLLHGDRLRIHHVEFEFALRGMNACDITVSLDDELPVATAASTDATRSGGEERETVGVRTGSAQTAKERLFSQMRSRTGTTE